MASNSSSTSSLVPLLPSTPYLLAYTLPLLFLSLILGFAGTFLTLDRSRSFPSRGGYHSLPAPGAFDHPKKKRRFPYQLEGGIGGLAGGFAFGLHLSTALALVIPVTTNSASLSPQSFLAVWILSCVVTTLVAGRYRYAAFAFLAMTGGTLGALAICVMIHPSLPSRVILLSIFLPLYCILVFAATLIPRLSFAFLHPLLRLCTATTGAFGMVVAISLLLNPKVEGWANVWERLWLRDGENWGSGKEQGLSAAFGVFLSLGIACDWVLKRWIGECPDEKWDNYLAQYAANLPNQSDRAGSFQPLTSVWDKFFPSSKAPFPPPLSKVNDKEIIFPSETDLKSKLPHPFPFMSLHNVPSAPTTFGKSTPGSQTGLPSGKDLLKKARSGRNPKSNPSGRRGKPVKFGAVDEMSSDSDSDEDDFVGKGVSSASTPTRSSPQIQQKRPWAGGITTPPRSSSSSTPTLVDGEMERRSGGATPRTKAPAIRKPTLVTDVALERLDYDAEISQLEKQRRLLGKEAVDPHEYSDFEEDLTTQRDLDHDLPQHRHRQPQATAGAGAGWAPAFMKRHQTLDSQSGAPLLSPGGPGPLPVPATPSLIKALDRIREAQVDAFGPAGVPVAPHLQPHPREGNSAAATGLERRQSRERAPRWEEFWREVRVKAQS